MKQAKTFGANVVVRIPEAMLAAMDREIVRAQRERPGMNRSDYVRELLARALSNGRDHK